MQILVQALYKMCALEVSNPKGHTSEGSQVPRVKSPKDHKSEGSQFQKCPIFCRQQIVRVRRSADGLSSPNSSLSTIQYISHNPTQLCINAFQPATTRTTNHHHSSLRTITDHPHHHARQQRVAFRLKMTHPFSDHCFVIEQTNVNVLKVLP